MPKLVVGPFMRVVRVRRSAARRWSRLETAQYLPRPSTLFVLSLSLGLATGLVEVILLYIRKHYIDSTAVSALQLNQYAIWMIPTSNALIWV